MAMGTLSFLSSRVFHEFASPFKMADLEHLKGKGRVFDGSSPVSTVQYEVRVYQKYIKSVTNQGRSQVPSLKGIELTLSVCSPPLLVSTRLLTLVMKDERKLKFLVVS